MSNPIKFTKRQDFIDALEARRPWAEAIDKANLAAHRKAEQAALKKFRDDCRRLAKLSYAELKARSRQYIRNSATFDPPSCPDSVVGKLDQALAALRWTRQERFTVDDTGQWRAAHWLLTYDETAPRDLCA